MAIINWEKATEREVELLKLCFSRVARYRGKMPDAVFVIRGENGGFKMSAMQYIESGKWERWGLQHHPPLDIKESWSTIIEWLRPIIGDRAAIEVFPREHQIVNTAPIRWFWILPYDEVPAEFCLTQPPFDPVPVRNAFPAPPMKVWDETAELTPEVQKHVLGQFGSSVNVNGSDACQR